MTKHIITVIWAAVAVVFLLLIVEPISIQGQFVVGTFVIFSMVYLSSLRPLPSCLGEMVAEHHSEHGLLE